jgi:hypothetical protein
VKQAEHTALSSLLRNETGNARFYFPLSLFGECCTPRWDFVVCVWSSTFDICVAAGISYFLGCWGVLGRSDWEEGVLVGGGVLFFIILLGLNDDEGRRGLGERLRQLDIGLAFSSVSWFSLGLAWLPPMPFSYQHQHHQQQQTTLRTAAHNDYGWVGGRQGGALVYLARGVFGMAICVPMEPFFQRHISFVA